MPPSQPASSTPARIHGGLTLPKVLLFDVFSLTSISAPT